jgi:hypothetical protein
MSQRVFARDMRSGCRAYRGHYRRMALKLLFALEFRSNNDRQAGHRHRLEFPAKQEKEDLAREVESPGDNKHAK